MKQSSFHSLVSNGLLQLKGFNSDDDVMMVGVSFLFVCLAGWISYVDSVLLSTRCQGGGGGGWRDDVL